MNRKPRLSFWQIWNISFGFLGVQFGFALQNANVSRILSNLGANVDKLPYFWVVAPLIGLIVQPWIGGASDRTWNRLGRRLPFILAGSIISVAAMVLLPNSSFIVAIMPPLAFGFIMLALMDGSFNITFQPFRSLVADMLPEDQRNVGYSMQSFLINVGAVIGSALPYILTNWLGVRNEAPAGQVPHSVIWSFYIGGAVLIISVLVTVIFTREYPPEEFRKYNAIDEKDKNERIGFLTTLKTMPPIMLQLARVQFFAWVALYLMWVFTTPAVAQHYWGTLPDDKSSASFNTAGNWVGIAFAGYSFFAALFSIVMPYFAKLTSRKFVYAFSLGCGALGYMSMNLFHNPHYILISMVGVGIAWAAILALPFAILSSSLPPKQMGVYMGIFNFTVAGPQIICAAFAGAVLQFLFHERAIMMLVLAGISMLCGAVAVYWVNDAPKKGS
jgi:maltose/moltooligosaccharide transporter